MGTESSIQLTEAARAAGSALDPALLHRIDTALDAASDNAETGRLWLARALTLQGAGEPARTGEAARRAVPHLVVAGELGAAALASAIAAASAVQMDELTTAIELAVDAVVMLSNVGQDEIDAIRAALAIAAFFARLAAFDLSTLWARRAFDGACRLSGVRVDAAAYSYGYVCAEGAHVSQDAAVRAERVAGALAAADWMAEHGGSAVSRVLLADGLRADAQLAAGTPVRPEDLLAGVGLYDQGSPDIVAWHQLVRATALARDGDVLKALQVLDEAIPALEASREDHCLVRALTERSAAREHSGDLLGALEDARRLAAVTRQWQLDLVGRLASQVADRADLQGALSKLQAEANRLTYDVEHDTVTGLRSRHWWEGRLETMLKGGDALDDVALGVMDLDTFKAVNDQHGHQAGDRVLRAVGVILLALAPHGAEVARIGGDEFAVILPRASGVEITTWAERVRRAVAEHPWEDIVDGLRVTLSIGTGAGRATSVHAVLAAADAALLRAKRTGRDQVV